MARTHSNALRQCFDRKIRLEVFKHVDVQLAQRFKSSCLSGEHVAVLRLALGANEEHNELVRHRECGLVPMILFDEVFADAIAQVFSWGAAVKRTH